MKKTIRIVLIVGALLTMVIAPALAQDTTSAVGAAASSSGIVDWLKSNWYIVLPLLYEFFVRLVPTATDWSWVNLIKTIIDWLIANKKPNGAKHK